MHQTHNEEEGVHLATWINERSPTNNTSPASEHSAAHWPVLLFVGLLLVGLVPTTLLFELNTWSFNTQAGQVSSAAGQQVWKHPIVPEDSSQPRQIRQTSLIRSVRAVAYGRKSPAADDHTDIDDKSLVTSSPAADGSLAADNHKADHDTNTNTHDILAIETETPDHDSHVAIDDSVATGNDSPNHGTNNTIDDTPAMDNESPTNEYDIAKLIADSPATDDNDPYDLAIDKALAEEELLDANTQTVMGAHALQLEHDGRDNRAAKLFRQAIQVEPKNIILLGNYANLLVKTGDLTQAESYFAAALSMDRELASYVDTLEDDTGNATAHAQYQRALDATPTYAIVLDDYAILLARQGRYTEARKHYIRSLHSRPDNPISHYNLACMYMWGREGISTQSLQELERATDLGYKRYDHVESDSDFNSVRSEHPTAFAKVMDRLQS